MMPGGLINSMNAEEMKNLIAYFVSGGDPNHKVFKYAKKLNIQLVRALYGDRRKSQKTNGCRNLSSRRSSIPSNYDL